MASSSKKMCMCSSCNGKLVNRHTFHHHSRKTIQEHTKLTSSQRYATDRKEKSQLNNGALQSPLYEGSSRTLYDAISSHFLIFATNSGMSKAALTECLTYEKSTLPQPNIFPSTYNEALRIIKPLLIPLRKYKCCVNDCKIFLINDEVRNCTICNESLMKGDSNRCIKTFSYMPITPRLARWYGTKNLAKILHSNQLSTNGRITDYTDGSIYKEHLITGVFKETDKANCVPLALFTDGVNPNKNTAVQKSMWPIILTWITLPQEIRYLLGPMLLVGIVPGNGRKEPKSLDPYIMILVEELLSNMECELFDSYKEAPVTVKVALLQYLCDIPAFGKLLHLSGQAALRSCMFCKEVGIRCNSLGKTIHISNRQFLPQDSELRKDPLNFAIKSATQSGRPGFYTKDQELEARREFDARPNKHQKTNFQKETGFRGMHPLSSLPYYDRLKQMQTDGMHTISDVIGNVLDLVSGKTDTAKVRNCEKRHDRFKETWVKESVREVENQPPPNTQTTNGPKKKRGKPITTSTNNDVENSSDKLPKAPWSLTSASLKIADNRAKSIKYPKGFDYTPSDHFSRQWTLRTMHGKQQFVSHNVAAWCLRGLLGKQQEKTLFLLFDVLKRLIKPTYLEEEIKELVEDTHIAVALLERDFPLALQNLTTHLLHHIPEGFKDFGPLYDRWLYPLERANSWITRQIIQHGHEEATVMQTYSIYDWSVFNLLEGTVKSCSRRQNTLHKVAEMVQNEDTIDERKENDTISLGSLKMLTFDQTMIMLDVYKIILNDDGIAKHEIDSNVQSVKWIQRYDNVRRRDVYFATDEHQTNSRSCDSIIRLNQEASFGQIRKIYKHTLRDRSFPWLLVDLFPVAESVGSFWCSDNVSVQSKLCLLRDVSNPLITAVDGNTIWFLNA